MTKKRKSEEPEVVGFLGIGLDNQDGHQRITHSEHFFLLGGSEETHEAMQDTVIQFDEALRKTGKTLEELPVDEVLDLLRESRR